MNWKLNFELSLFAVAMAFGTVFAIPPNVEPAFWLVIFLICGYIIARRSPKSPFAHGIVLGLVNSIWITAAHIIFFERYIAGHPQEAAMMKSMPVASAPRLMMAITGPIVGLISGILIGGLAFGAAKLLNRHAMKPAV